MKTKNLQLKNIEQVLNLEEDTYWKGEEWQDLWKKEAKKLFRKLIGEYIANFPEGCFGLFDEKNDLQGAIIFAKLEEIKPISYVHNFKDYFASGGKVAYVQIFAIKKGERELEIAKKLYREAKKISRKINCDKIAVVIYSSLIEEKTLKKLGYKVLQRNLKWEIYPKKFVDCKIYVLDIC